jgi:hypothetical protein
MDQLSYIIRCIIYLHITVGDIRKILMYYINAITR